MHRGPERVGTVHDVVRTSFALKVATNRSRCGLRGVGRAVELANAPDGIFALEHDDHHGPGRHRRYELWEERTIDMRGVELPYVICRHANLSAVDDAETSTRVARDDLGGRPFRHPIGLDDGKSSLDQSTPSF